MSKVNRRRWLESLGSAAVASALPSPEFGAQLKSPEGAGKMKLDLADFRPKSMLHVPETKVPKPRYPVVDIHTHLSIRAKSVNGVGVGEKMDFLATPQTLLPVMDRRDIRILVNLTGGSGKGLEETIQRFDKTHPDRFITFTEPTWDHSNQPGYPQFQAEEIERAHRAGARGLKVLKTLGLYLRENVSEGRLIRIDDPRFDPMWEACGSLNMPVAIHVSDPEAFFLPTDGTNERFEELNQSSRLVFPRKGFSEQSRVARGAKQNDREASENAIRRSARRQRCGESHLRQRMHGSLPEYVRRDRCASG